MKIGFLQFSPAFCDVNLTLERLESYIKTDNDIDLLVLPELCNSGYNFTSKDEAIESTEEISSSLCVEYLTEKCKDNNLVIATGFNEKAKDLLYNSSILINKDGVIGHYRKLHLFKNENKYFEPGNLGLPVFSFCGIRIGMLICFDWAFPEVWRILALKGVDIICHPSNLVLPRFAQKTIPIHSLLNRVFIITANRVGSEKDLIFTGESLITNPQGDILTSTNQTDEIVKTVEIDASLSRDKRITDKNHMFLDRRTEEYTDIVNLQLP